MRRLAFALCLVASGLTEVAAAPADEAAAPTAIFMRHNSGWSVSILLSEPATALQYRIGETGAFRDTGSAPYDDPRTLKPAPRADIPMPATQGATTIYVRYATLAGAWKGPFPLPFEPRAALERFIKYAMQQIPYGWVELRPYDGRMLLYTTTLVSYRCGIASARYGLDGAPARIPVALPGCDMRDPYAIPSAFVPYVDVPVSTRSVTVDLVFADGEAAAPVTIEVSP